MNVADSKICLEAFNRLCAELSASKLVSLEECQYWLFERGYQAAVDELINNISIASKLPKPIALEQKYLFKEELAFH